MSSSQFNWHTPNRHDEQVSYYYDTPVGQLIFRTHGKILCNIEWITHPSSGKITSPLPKELQKQFNGCWLSPKPEITLPLLCQGTAFQHTVWDLLCHIPIGQTKTYAELANTLNTSPRALANACRKNPFPLLIPCHRVLAKTGIGGYAGTVTGKLIIIKKSLLQYEKLIAHDL